VQISCHKPDRY